MYGKILAGAVFAAAAITLWMPLASADTTDATCDVREKGKQKAEKSGRCTFSQRRGYVSIELRDGETFELEPGNQANQFKDQKNRHVKRTIDGEKQVYNWEHRHITVSFDRYSNSSHRSNSGHNQAPEIVMGRNGEGEVIFNNDCVVYYKANGQRREKNSHCSQGQVERADDAISRYRREQGR